MNLLKYIAAASFLGLLLAGCKQDNLPIYSQKQDNVFFNFANQEDRDSITFTFAYTPSKTSDTLYLPIGISGEVPKKNLYFKVAVTDSGTTAKAGLHYAPLADSFMIAAGQTTTQIPVIIYNEDTALASHSVALNLHLTASSDLGVQLTDIVTARILISDKLEEPAWWPTWMTHYSDEKFELFIIATNGVTSMPDKNVDSDYGLYAPQALYYIGLMNSLIADPFKWVASNPSRGYVLVQQTDGSFLFYNPETPAIHLTVVYDATSNQYLFPQSIGGDVTPN